MEFRRYADKAEGEYRLCIDDDSENDIYLSIKEATNSCGILELENVSDFISYLYDENLKPEQIAKELLIALQKIKQEGAARIMMSVVRSSLNTKVFKELEATGKVTVFNYKKNPNSGNYINMAIY
jgi:hypothetical protein